MSNPLYPPAGPTPQPAAPTAPMDPAALLLWAKAALDIWALANGGYVSIAGDPAEIMEALLDAPPGFRVVLNYAGDEDQTGQELVGITTHKFEAWLIKKKGLKLRPGDSLVTGTYPFLTVLSDLRAQVRALRYPDTYTQIYPLYKGSQQFEPALAASLDTTGYRLAWELIAATPAIVVS